MVDSTRHIAPVSAVLLNVDEAAGGTAAVEVNDYELIRSNQLRTVKQGRRRLVPVSALADYVAALEARAA